jgi:hypothetical protein
MDYCLVERRIVLAGWGVIGKTGGKNLQKFTKIRKNLQKLAKISKNTRYLSQNVLY